MTWRRRLGVVATVVTLPACSGGRSPDAAPEAPSPPPTAAVVATTAAAPEPRLVVHRLGETFMLGDVQLALLSVQDPFPATPQTQPAPGDRLVSIRYEMVNASAEIRNLSDLPSVEIRDAAGNRYRSEHGRLSVVAGSRNPGELVGGKRIESSAIFEVPASATSLRAAFRAPSAPDGDAVVVPLD